MLKYFLGKMDNSKILFALFFEDSPLSDIRMHRFRIFSIWNVGRVEIQFNFSDAASVEAQHQHVVVNSIAE
jgi:hypothetical protein